MHSDSRIAAMRDCVTAAGMSAACCVSWTWQGTLDSALASRDWGFVLAGYDWYCIAAAGRN